jgi:hypothetical protein
VRWGERKVYKLRRKTPVCYKNSFYVKWFFKECVKSLLGPTRLKRYVDWSDISMTEQVSGFLNVYSLSHSIIAYRTASLDPKSHSHQHSFNLGLMFAL